MENKRRYRYNWHKQEWEEVFTLDLRAVVIPGTMRPDGSLNSFTVPYDQVNTNWEVYASDADS